MNLKPDVTIIGAGLAGCEAAWQAAQFGVSVRLIDMKPLKKSAAHHEDTFAELVCSNSFKAMRLQSASGLLKEELRLLGSMLLEEAAACALPAGGALAVDRTLFSTAVTARIRNCPLIDIVSEEVQQLPGNGTSDGVVIIATGPLTEGRLFESIRKELGLATLHFYDAAAPIVYRESIDQSIAFRQSRYDRGGSDYFNCPMDQNEYQKFYENLTQAELAEVKDFDREAVFEGCMPIETMAKRGQDTLRFGPMKPVGLIDPRTGKRPYACIQLRQDNQAGDLYNMVGFQTRLKFSEQQRVFRMIPGLENAEFARFGVMHRNTFINSPHVLHADYSTTHRSNLFFAGQITGVEGYVAAISSGLIAGISAALTVLGHKIDERMTCVPDKNTMIGALARYVSDPSVRHFQPMNANYGLLAQPDGVFKQKDARYLAMAERSLTEIQSVADRLNKIRSKETGSKKVTSL